jgi:hypothetical protein
MLVVFFFEEGMGLEHLGREFGVLLASQVESNQVPFQSFS